MRIVLVEDDVPLRESLASNLRDHRFTVDEAGTAAEGEYYVAEFDTMLAIIDLGLPDRPGSELVATLRAHGRSLPMFCIAGIALVRMPLNGVAF